jgi:hypothetical protein
MEGITTQPGDGTGGYEMTMRAKKAAAAVTIRVERALWRELKKLAVDRDVTLEALVDGIIRGALERVPAVPGGKPAQVRT